MQFALVLNSTVAGVAHAVQLLITNDTTNSMTDGTAVLQSTVAATYTVASVKGIFASQFNSWTADLNQTRNGNVGLGNFNGAGKVTGSFTEMNGGVLLTVAATGTYTVNADGSGTMSLVSGTDSFQIAFVLNTVVSGHPKGLQLLLTTEGGSNRVDSGVAQKQ